MKKDIEPKPGKQPTVPASNTPEAAGLIDRAQSGDAEALMQILNSGEVIVVDDMPGQLREFEKKQGAKKP